ncbi:MAG: hypothetical protein LBR54_05080 [Oscillospiraceae bacterium]|jgi:hypothetical protein|nr:hypothetical protein [Oscillospiraceae bacterium]
MMKIKNSNKKIKVYKPKWNGFKWSGLSDARRQSIIYIGLVVLLCILMLYTGYALLPRIIGPPNADKETQASTASTDQTALTSVTESQTENTDTPPVKETSVKAYRMNLSEIADTDSLRTGIEKIKNSGYNTVVLPLKVTGGGLYYVSEVSGASWAVRGELSLSDAVSVIRESGLVPAASMSVMADHIRPKYHSYSGYMFDAQEEFWLDNKRENAGKPWLSPFSEGAKTYTASIAAEIAAAGFEKLFCGDFVFPPFRDKDLEYIGWSVKNPERYTALVDMAKIIGSTASEYGTVVYIEETSDRIINSSSEIFKPEHLNGAVFAVKINLEKTAPEKLTDDIAAVLDKLEGKADKKFVLPVIVIGDAASGQIAEIGQFLSDRGYPSFSVEKYYELPAETLFTKAPETKETSD